MGKLPVLGMGRIDCGIFDQSTQRPQQHVAVPGVPPPAASGQSAAWPVPPVTSVVANAASEKDQSGESAGESAAPFCSGGGSSSDAMPCAKAPAHPKHASKKVTNSRRKSVVMGSIPCLPPRKQWRYSRTFGKWSPRSIYAS